MPKPTVWWVGSGLNLNLVFPLYLFQCLYPKKCLSIVPVWSYSLCSSFFIVFFPITIYPPYILFHLHPLPSPLQLPIVVHAHEFFFFFARSFFPQPHPHSRAISLLSESVSIFLVSSVCPLDSTYEWNHMVFVFLWLAYFP